MNVAIINRPKLEMNESLSSSEDVGPLENKQINLSSNELAVAQYRASKQQFQQQGDTSKIFIGRANTIITSSENELLDTNNNTINRTPNISNNEASNSKNNRYISQSARKEIKSSGNSIIPVPKTKLGEYLQKSVKSKFKERKNPALNVQEVKKTLDFNNEEVKTNKKERRDVYGTVISKKNRRKVRVSFVDWISDEPLIDVTYIESYKGLNYIKNMPKEDFMIKPRCECCGIF